MTVKDLRVLVKFARKQGILKLKMNGLEIELSQSAISPTKITRTPKVIDNSPPPVKYTEEDMLYWSSQAIDPAGEQ